MSALIDNVQIITDKGRPAFVVMPYEDFLKIQKERARERGLIPQEIVRRTVLDDVPAVKAWREYIGMTQQELADAAGIKQPVLARIETGVSKPRRSTLMKLARAMNLTLEQLEPELAPDD